MVTQDAYFSLLTHTKQLLFVTFYDTLVGVEVRFGWTEPNHGTGTMELELRMDRQTWMFELVFINTRKYPLGGYIQGVLTHTPALDRLWGGDETLKSIHTWYLEL